NCGGTASQLISRRPLPKEPGWLGLSEPSRSRKASTDDPMSHAHSNTWAWDLSDPSPPRAGAARSASDCVVPDYGEEGIALAQAASEAPSAAASSTDRGFQPRTGR